MLDGIFLFEIWMRKNKRCICVNWQNHKLDDEPKKDTISSISIEALKNLIMCSSKSVIIDLQSTRFLFFRFQQQLNVIGLILYFTQRFRGTPSSTLLRQNIIRRLLGQDITSQILHIGSLLLCNGKDNMRRQIVPYPPLQSAAFEVQST